MTFFKQWLRNPQRTWLRKALFQVHLWTGIGVGLYLFTIGVTGSLLVFRPELYFAFTGDPTIVTPTGQLLTDEGLKQAALRVYPGYQVTQIFRGRAPNSRAAEIWLERDGTKRQRLFNPYTGEDLKESVPRGIKVMAWTLDLHDNLLGGTTGRTLNGIGGGLLAVLCLTGGVIWWPGIARWRRSLMVGRTSTWKRFNWELHSTIGFWSLVVLFGWAITGIYLVFPQPFMAVVDLFGPIDDITFKPRVGDTILEYFGKLHFGRFAGRPLKIAWVVLGLAPSVLFVTGAIMWWTRVLRHGPRQSQASDAAD